MSSSRLAVGFLSPHSKRKDQTHFCLIMYLQMRTLTGLSYICWLPFREIRLTPFPIHVQAFKGKGEAYFPVEDSHTSQMCRRFKEMQCRKMIPKGENFPPKSIPWQRNVQLVVSFFFFFFKRIVQFLTLYPNYMSKCQSCQGEWSLQQFPVCTSLPCQLFSYFCGLHRWPRPHLGNAAPLGGGVVNSMKTLKISHMRAILSGPCHCSSLLRSEELISVLYIIL